jgi:hypothetical protein
MRIHSVTLTKKALLANAKPTKPHLIGTFFECEVYVKPMSELKRSRRVSGMFNKEGSISDSYKERARIYTITDHVCDEEGNSLYSDKDITDLMQIEARLLNPLVDAISAWSEDSEKNE